MIVANFDSVIQEPNGNGRFLHFKFISVQYIFIYQKCNFVKRLSPVQWHSLQITSIRMSGSFQFKRQDEQWKISGLGHYLLLYVWMNINRRRREVATYISCNNMAANTAVLMSSYLSITAQTFLLNKEKYDVFD